MTLREYIATAQQVLKIEANAVAMLVSRIGPEFGQAVDAILASKGRVVVCGMGKSGIVGRKIAATFASTGTPSFFMHPGEAYHGDLGMVTNDDIFLAISNSGQTDEIVKLLAFLRNNRNFVVAMTGNGQSTLAKAAHCHLDVAVEMEACPHQLAPTASTTAALAMGDALAITLMNARGFRPENFARFHPGGALGRRLLATVGDEMISTQLPFINEDAKSLDVFRAMTQGRLGLAIVKHSEGWGVVTDGDIRRAIVKFGNELFNRSARDFMTNSPVTVSAATRVEDALNLMESHRIGALLVANGSEIVGVFKK